VPSEAREPVEVRIIATISVELAAMEAGEADFRQILNALQATLDTLDGQLRASLAAWDGEARAAYQVAHARWRAAAQDMADRLAWLHGVIQTAGGNYASARGANLTMWRGH
jgi:WXG100 family type VII secretion target